MKIKILLLIITLLFSINCGGTRYINPNEASGSAEWGPLEVKTTVKKMVNSMYSYFKTKEKNVFIALQKIRNRTSEHIDVKMLSNQLITNLLKKKIKFIDKSKRVTALKEADFAQSGVTDSDEEFGNLKSPNFILDGSITDNVRYVSGSKVQYLVVTLKLTKLSTTEIVWQDQKEFLKSTKENQISW